MPSPLDGDAFPATPGIPCDNTVNAWSVSDANTSRSIRCSSVRVDVVSASIRLVIRCLASRPFAACQADGVAKVATVDHPTCCDLRGTLIGVFSGSPQRLQNRAPEGSGLAHRGHQRVAGISIMGSSRVCPALVHDNSGRFFK